MLSLTASSEKHHFDVERRRVVVLRMDDSRLQSTSRNGTLNLGLHQGAAAGNLGLVKFALDHGQPVNSQLHGVLPIHAASCGGSSAAVQYLIDHGADVNARRARRNSIEYGAGNKREDYVAGTSGSTPLLFASANGHRDAVELLLRNGAKPHIPDKYGATPISVALARNHRDIVTILENSQNVQMPKKGKRRVFTSKKYTCWKKWWQKM